MQHSSRSRAEFDGAPLPQREHATTTIGEHRRKTIRIELDDQAPRLTTKQRMRGALHCVSTHREGAALVGQSLWLVVSRYISRLPLGFTGSCNRTWCRTPQ